MDILGIGVGVSSDGILHDSRNTFSPSDFAYWCSTYIVSGIPSNYEDDGLDKGSGSLISWAAKQVGIQNMPNTYEGIQSFCSSMQITVKEAIAKRGALLVNATDIAICMGFTDIELDINGRHFIQKLTPTDILTWEYGMLIPGLDYL